ncbi:MAG: UDP-N-acetylenolpyruvoylglucosamine reductase [Pseudomonadota bacterium]
MNLEKNVPLQPYNTFGIAAKAQALVRVHSEADLLAVLADPQLATLPRQVLGGGSNIVLTGDVKALVLKVEVPGLRLASETDKHWVIEAGAGESWHDLVAWSLDNGYPGLENMALIPGTVGASPVQNIGAYGVELQDRFDSLDAMDMFTGELFSLNAAQCGFSYRDSVFKHASGGPDGLGLAGRAVILRVRFALAKRWKPELGYLDLERKMAETGIHNPDARQIFDWVVAIRRAKLTPRPAGDRQCRQFLQEPHRHPRAVRRHHRPRPEGGALPHARRQHQTGRRLADRRLRLERQDRGPRRGVREAGAGAGQQGRARKPLYWGRSDDAGQGDSDQCL